MRYYVKSVKKIILMYLMRVFVHNVKNKNPLTEIVINFLTNRDHIVKYCKNCGGELEDKYKFCDECGKKIISSAKNSLKRKAKDSISKESSDKYIFPAILSFFIPTLGQFIKGQFSWAFTLWTVYISGCLLIFVLSSLLNPAFFLLVFPFGLGIWVYQIYDAYNTPEPEK